MIQYGTIHLQHLKYEVHVRELAEDHEHTAYTKRLDSHSSAVYLKKTNHISTVAHELVHVLQFICKARHIAFADETEHVAYTMSFLMDKVLGVKYLDELPPPKPAPVAPPLKTSVPPPPAPKRRAPLCTQCGSPWHTVRQCSEGIRDSEKRHAL